MNNSSNNITKWYRRKVDRMGRIDGVFIEKLASRSVTLLINTDELSYYSNQVMVIVSTILLSNWCSTIHVVIEKDVSSVVPGFDGKSMKAVITELIFSNDDEITFQFHNTMEVETDGYLSIGAPTIDNPGMVWMNADGWISGLGNSSKTYQEISKSKNINPIGPVFSACIAHSVLFKIILGIGEETEFSKWFSLHDYNMATDNASLTNPVIPENIDFGKIIQIGCGAVGSSFDFILSLTKFSGNISLIDYDPVEPANLISSLLFVKRNALNGDKKVNVCSGVLEKSNLKPTPFDGDYSEFIRSCKYSENYPDIILCFANEHNVWSTIQNNYPPIVFHATTTPNWGINYGRHIPLKDWCIVCRFGVNNSNATPVCAESLIEETSQNDEKPKLGVLPFLSPASALLAFGELVKFNMEAKLSSKNFTQFGMKSAKHAHFYSVQMPKKEDCAVCSRQYKEVYKLYLNKSKYSI